MRTKTLAILQKLYAAKAQRALLALGKAQREHSADAECVHESRNALARLTAQSRREQETARVRTLTEVQPARMLQWTEIHVQHRRKQVEDQRGALRTQTAALEKATARLHSARGQANAALKACQSMERLADRHGETSERQDT